MTAADIQNVVKLAEEIAPLAGPYGVIAANLCDAAVHLAALLFQKGELTEAEVADVKARAGVADDAWDAAVAKARAASAVAGAQ
jgi:hypothetical protein